MKFPLGQIVATPGALDALQESGEEPGPYLPRHNGGDWGELDEHDRRENEVSLEHGFRSKRLQAANRSHHLGLSARRIAPARPFCSPKNTEPGG